MNAIKPIIGAALLAGLSVPLFLQHQSLAALREQNTALAGQVTEVASLRTENERLTRLAAGAGALESLRKDQLELARLRNEHIQLNRSLDELRREVERQRELLAAYAARENDELTIEEREARRQVLIESSFAEIPIDSMVWQEFGLVPPANADDEGGTRLLDRETAGRLLERLAEIEGGSVLSTPRMTTANGRQAQIKTVEIQTVVTGKQGESIQTEPMEFGPVLDVIPTFEVGGAGLQLSATASLHEFIGYDDPGAFTSWSADGATVAVAAPGTPLPRTQFRQVTSQITLAQDQVLVMTGGYGMKRTVTGNPITADNVARGLIVVLSPREVTPMGFATPSPEQ